MPEQFPYPQEGWSTGTMKKKGAFPSDVGEGARALGGTSTIDTMQRLHQERMKAQGIPEKTADFEELSPEEHKALMWDTPVTKSSPDAWGATPQERRQQMDDIMSRTQEDYDKYYQELQGSKTFTSQGGPIPAGRVRGHKDIPAFKEYLNDLPPDVSAHDMKDGTIIFRKRSALTS